MKDEVPEREESVEKERYFTPAAIAEKARDMLASVERCRRRHDGPADLQKSALLVLDMQRYFLEEKSHAFIPSATAIVPGVVRLVETCAAAKLPVFFTRHVNTPADAGMMARWWDDMIRDGDPLSDLISPFNTGREIVIGKQQYDAFYGTKLGELLRERDVGRVMITGVMTHLCCDTTARAAFVRGFEVSFVIDGTATYTEAFHRATVRNLAHGVAVPVLVEELVNSI